MAATIPTVALLLAASAALSLTGCIGSQGRDSAPVGRTTASDLTVVPIEDAAWGALNPARGEAGPRAANLWGDRATSDATGFLVRFAEGFSSPPHIHNVTYRGIVIEGLIHNDDPNAEESWMAPGSYWTQPEGEVHITSAKGEGRLAYIEIQRGPYLVLPPEDAVDTGERALNVHAANLVWLDASTTNRIKLSGDVVPSHGPRMTFLWGDPQNDAPSGALVAVPAGSTTTFDASDPEIRVVVIKGRPSVHQSSSESTSVLAPGSFVGSNSSNGSQVTFTTREESWLYVRARGSLQVHATRQD